SSSPELFGLGVTHYTKNPQSTKPSDFYKEGATEYENNKEDHKKFSIVKKLAMYMGR
ncbi:hypothetical protein BB561_005527, partial [Smittium simulii]